MTSPFSAIFQLSKQGGLGLACDREGVTLGPVSLMDALDEKGQRTYRRRPADEIARALTNAYGPLKEEELAARLRGLDVARRALEAGDLALAGIATVQMKLPALTPAAFAKLAGDASLKKYSPDQPRDEHGRWTSDEGDSRTGGGHRGQIRVASNETALMSDASGSGVGSEPSATSARIADVALSHVGSTNWSDDVENGNYQARSNKCNLFVYDVLTEAGASPGTPNGIFHKYPPLAGQWADPNYEIPGWRVLRPDETPMPGDVVAQRIRYDDASGHVMIVGTHDNFIGTGNPLGAPKGTIEDIPRPENLGPADIPHGPLVFRRWDPRS